MRLTITCYPQSHPATPDLKTLHMALVWTSAIPAYYTPEAQVLKRVVALRNPTKCQPLPWAAFCTAHGNHLLLHPAMRGILMY